MMKENIAKIIYEELCYMYCNNCRYNSEIGEDAPDYGCDDCHRRCNGWGISMAEASRIAEMIGDDTDRPKGEWEYCKHEGISDIWKCNQCGAWMFGKTNYCPNCGVDMRGDKYE